MQNFRAKVSQLGGFAVRNFRNGAGLGDQSRIGGDDAIHVGPDNHFVGVHGRAQNRRGIIGTAAAKSGELAIFGGADKSGDDRNGALGEQRAATLPPRAGGSIPCAAQRRRDKHR